MWVEVADEMEFATGEVFDNGRVPVIVPVAAGAGLVNGLAGNQSCSIYLRFGRNDSVWQAVRVGKKNLVKLDWKELDLPARSALRKHNAVMPCLGREIGLHQRKYLEGEGKVVCRTF